MDACVPEGRTDYSCERAHFQRASRGCSHAHSAPMYCQAIAAAMQNRQTSPRPGAGAHHITLQPGALILAGKSGAHTQGHINRKQ